MKLYYHSVLSSNRSQEGKILKNSCTMAILYIFQKIQYEMKLEALNFIREKYPLEDQEKIRQYLFQGRTFQGSYDLLELKNSFRTQLVESFSGVHTMNFSELAKDLNMNVTRLKRELEKAAKQVFEFNYLDRKKISVKLISGFITGVEFQNVPKGVDFSFQIPIKILEFLIFPEQYSTIDMTIVKKLRSKYAASMYLLIMDHQKRGVLELKRSEILEAFSLPGSYEKDRNLFVNRFLAPLFREIEEASGMKLKYDFRPSHGFGDLLLKIQRDNILFPENISEKIKFAKQNRFLSKAWDSKTPEYLFHFLLENGESDTIKLLCRAYSDLKEPVRTTLPIFFISLWKKIQAEPEIKKSREDSEEKVLTLVEKKNSPEDPLTVAWKTFQNFDARDKKIYRNLAKLSYKEMTGAKKHDEMYFEAAFKSLLVPLICI